MSIPAPKSVVVAGGAGFIGSNFARMLLERGYERVRVLDKLTYAGNPANVADLTRYPGYSFVHADICDAGAVLAALDGFEALVNFAAETHVDRSLMNPGEFIQTDVFGVYVLLEAVRATGMQRFVHVSTDEVYGHVPVDSSVETDPLAPRNPYSASKAGGELLIRAYVETYDVPALITRGSNTYGPYQYPEKLLSLAITNVLDNEPIPIYGDGRQVRDWLHVADHAAGIELVLREGDLGEIYNIGGGNERHNLDVIEIVLDQLDAPRDFVRHVTDRQGHDRRYSLDTTKLRALGWKPQHAFEAGLRSTVDWYRDNRPWWEALKADAGYQGYYERNYAFRKHLDIE
jgi:dTDP-glucose 4,6-dehydratase